MVFYMSSRWKGLKESGFQLILALIGRVCSHSISHTVRQASKFLGQLEPVISKCNEYYVRNWSSCVHQLNMRHNKAITNNN